MILTPEQQALLDGKEGEIMAKIVKKLHTVLSEVFSHQECPPKASPRLTMGYHYLRL